MSDLNLDDFTPATYHDEEDRSMAALWKRLARRYKKRLRYAKMEIAYLKSQLRLSEEQAAGMRERLKQAATNGTK